MLQEFTESALGRAINALPIHSPQIVAPVPRHVGCEEVKTWRGFAVILYRWMLSTATEYAVRLSDIPSQKKKDFANNFTIHPMFQSLQEKYR
jgi:hypothetical protein